MLSKEIREKVRKIQLKMTKVIDAAMAGYYVSAFKGAGIEFDEVREYQPGDDVRTIDWNVTARAGAPFIKRYIEERELTVMLAVDLSASQRFGTASAFKNEIAAEISALLAFLAIYNHDKVGLVIFSDTIEKYVPPQKDRRHVLRVIREILGYQAQGAGTNLGEALHFVNRVSKHRSIIFLISDFLDIDCEKPLKSTVSRHDLVAIGINDPRETDLPDLGLIELEDLETGQIRLIDTASAAVRNLIQDRGRERQAQIAKLFKSNKVDYISLSTHTPYLDPLQKFFLKRARRL
ncbi:MAG: DUF58 domain-containing protein [Bacillota bacterium]|jgi:uncharacterized protein (DUF58 family)